MKKVLILAYDFPPYVSVGGLRPFNWFKYFKEFGIAPIVVTRQWSNKYGNHLDYIAPSESKKVKIEEVPEGTIIRAPYKPNLSNRILLKYGVGRFKLLRKVLTGYFEILQYFLPIGTKYSVFQAAKQYLQHNEVDLIVATGDPFILFKYGHKLSKKYDIPWIADYRDPWSQNTDNRLSKIESLLYPKLEKKYLSSVSAVTTVSKHVQHGIENLCSNKTFKIISNGFDPEAVESIKEINQNTEVLTITYAGSIYEWHPYLSFLEAVSDWIKDKKTVIKLRFLGTNKQDQLKELCKSKFPELYPNLEISSKMPNQVLLAELKKANVLLLFNDYYYLGTKIFDYLAVGRKILFCYTVDDEAITLKKDYYVFGESKQDSDQLQADLIKETHSGVCVRDKDQLIEVLDSLYNEFDLKRLIENRTENIERFSRRKQTEELASFIQSL